MSDCKPLYIHLKQLETLRDFSFMFGCPVEIQDQLPCHELRVKLITGFGKQRNAYRDLESNNSLLRPFLLHTNGMLSESVDWRDPEECKNQ